MFPPPFPGVAHLGAGVVGIAESGEERCTGKQVLVLSLALILTCCVTLGEQLLYSGPQLSHL